MTAEQKETLWSTLKTFAPDSISWNHYDLAAQTPIQDVELWKEFLTQRDVIDWIKDEQTLLQRYELAKLSTDVANSRSVGQAQLISAMAKINSENENAIAKGPIFIYTYVPLNAEQEHAPNVVELKEDIFLDKTKQIKSEAAERTEELPIFTV